MSNIINPQTLQDEMKGLQDELGKRWQAVYAKNWVTSADHTQSYVPLERKIREEIPKIQNVAHFEKLAELITDFIKTVNSQLSTKQEGKQQLEDFEYLVHDSVIAVNGKVSTPQKRKNELKTFANALNGLREAIKQAEAFKGNPVIDRFRARAQEAYDEKKREYDDYVEKGESMPHADKIKNLQELVKASKDIIRLKKADREKLVVDLVPVEDDILKQEANLKKRGHDSDATLLGNFRQNLSEQKKKYVAGEISLTELQQSVDKDLTAKSGVFKTHRGLDATQKNILFAIVTLGIGYLAAGLIQLAATKGEKFTLFRETRTKTQQVTEAAGERVKKLQDADEDIEVARPAPKGPPTN